MQLVHVFPPRAPDDTATNATCSTEVHLEESGREKVGVWQDITRNVVDDYRRAFGE